MKATLDPLTLLSWSSQAEQYPSTGPIGISYFAGEVPDHPPVDCLLFYAEAGLVGILNYYSVDYTIDGTVIEHAGNFNVWTRPQFQRRGIATALITEADKRWTIDFEQQRYTPNGLAVAERYLAARLTRHMQQTEEY